MVTINGEPHDAAGQNLQTYLQDAGFDLSRIVVEKNLEIIPRDQLSNHVIQDEDAIEVLRFVGGG
ncbi:MAG: sulfur carrier protein ThiS [Agathobacter sp.]|uniref:sulfur carrier protein ThiS n=1 Tax=Agathobacter sp. TaxID=2021311 RepID=UPI002585E6DB|nr:sulfur carrier protein ThiS [Agathobacter sp.]MCR5676866.1 sulfur carrier protein ThiS [Agathobacter sp.]